MKIFNQLKRCGILSIGTILAVALAAPLTSCSDSDGDGDGGKTPNIPDLSALPYENVSAKYEISTTGSDIRSIELTAAGNYIVTTNPYASVAISTGAAKASLLRIPGKTPSRSSYNGIIYGKFTKISDTEFILEGFGSISIEGTSNNAVSIIVTTQDGNSSTVSAVKASENPDSEITKAMCRTWNIDKIGISTAINNSKVYEKTDAASKFWDLYNESEIAFANWMNAHFPDPEDPFEPEIVDYDFYPTQILLSRSGTYLVTYSNNAMAVATWHWTKESEGQFHYSWDYDDPNNNSGTEGGEAIVTFSGNSMTITEPHTISDEGLTLTSKTIYHCSQANN